MVLNPLLDIKDLEHEKFVEDDSGDVAVNTVLSTGDIQIGAVEIKDATSSNRAIVTNSSQLTVVDSVANSLVPNKYDYIGLSYTGSDLTGVVFKKNGSSGLIISTLTLAYDGGTGALASVTKT